jgi:predicted nucleic acid-binding protein
LPEEKATSALQKLQDLAFEEIAPGFDTDEDTLLWARRIGQIVAYDAVYLALAQGMNAEFWTADKRLATAAQNAGVNWVHWLGQKV